MFFNILKSFKKRKKFCFFMILQLLFCFISLNECFSMIDYYNNNIKSVKKIIFIDNTFAIENKAMIKDIDKIDFDKIDSFYEFLNKDVNVDKKGGYIYYQDILGVDKAFLSYDTFNVFKGRNFNDKDFNDKDSLPILLGYNFKDKYKIGENINVNQKNIK